MTFSFAATSAGKFLCAFHISTAPIIELRGGLPYGIAQGLDYPLTLMAAILGNMVPVPFIIVYIFATFLRGFVNTVDGGTKELLS
ncbi:small multi-drug export protein [Oscillibacter sp.]|uniref:small multi-drug export protein n=1 Tax=Oscillibacter sp. TaxID=1945593 RepID=UPI002896AB9F|nr:small multi-drug export protein [Oscillibacter sp.]